MRRLLFFLITSSLLAGVILTSDGFSVKQEEQKQKGRAQNPEALAARSRALKEREEEAGVLANTPEACPSGWSLIVHGLNDPFCYFSPPSLVLGWDAARNACLGLGGDLVSFETTTEYKQLLTVYTGNSTNLLYLTWTGLRYARYLSTSLYEWDWSDGLLDSYIVWASGKTPTPDGYSNCSAWKTVGSKTGLQALPCHYQQPFLCKQDAGFCNGGNFSSSTHKGTITSPNYPNGYFNNLDCIYTINGGAGNTVFLAFTVYKVEALFDSVTIYDGPSINSRVIAKITLGITKLEYESTGQYITVRFRTDHTGTDKGWSADWQANRDDTPIFVNGTNAGTLSSPNYPTNYPNGVDQVYYVVAPDPFKINVTFTDFVTEANYDILYVFDAPTADFTTPFIFNLSGRPTIPSNFVTNTSTLSLRFQSDLSYNYKGWSLNWIVV